MTRQKCDSLQQDAERRKAEISEEVEEIREQLHFLNLQKQQFLRAAVSMLIDFGQVVDKAQQEFELEMAGKMEDLEAEDSTDSKEDAPAEEVVDQSESSSEAEADPINARPDCNPAAAAKLSRELNAATPAEQDALYRLYTYAADSGEPEILRHYAACLDPSKPQWGSIGKDPAAAWQLYERAGASEAQQQMKSWLEQQAAGGDAQ